jgi:hypothetical protein
VIHRVPDGQINLSWIWFDYEKEKLDLVFTMVIKVECSYE